MNPAHRDRIAFVRICSGKFERGMTVNVSSNRETIKAFTIHSIYGR